MWKREDVAISVPQWVLWTVLAAPLVSFMLSLSAFPSPFFIEDAVVMGYADPRFASIRRLFKQNFDEGLEREGANVAVYHGGRLVVNLWAGYADSEADRPWKANTRSVLFSTTKAMASVCIGMLVDRGYLSYDDLVVKYWPAYGQNGKNSTTIEHVLTHQAGLPYLEEPVTMDDVRQVQPLLRKIERSSPQWQPGDYTGYHAITFGFIVDGIMRHVDPKGRDLKTFFKEEVAEPYGLDLDIGVPKSESHKLARITLPGILEFIRDTVRDPRILGMLALMHIRPSDTHLHRLIANPDWVVINYDTVSVNDPEVLELPLGSVTGVGNAANLAKLFGLVLDGTLLSNSTLELMREPTLNDWHLERITVYPLMKGRGFFYDAHPVLSGKYVFGHPGYGGQMLIVDPENDLVIAYVANGLKTGSSVLCRGPQRLFHEVYRVLYSM